MDLAVTPEDQHEPMDTLAPLQDDFSRVEALYKKHISPLQFDTHDISVDGSGVHQYAGPFKKQTSPSQAQVSVTVITHIETNSHYSYTNIEDFAAEFRTLNNCVGLYVMT